MKSVPITKEPKELTIANIKELFADVFPTAQHLFAVTEIPLNLANVNTSELKDADKPGIYVFWKNNRVIKVGRHMVNAHQRARQHIKDRTHNKNDNSWNMGELENDPQTILLLFTIIDNKKDKKEWVHWVCGLEPFFELNLDPVIHSDRLC